MVLVVQVDARLVQQKRGELFKIVLSSVVKSGPLIVINVREVDPDLLELVINLEEKLLQRPAFVTSPVDLEVGLVEGNGKLMEQGLAGLS